MTTSQKTRETPLRERIVNGHQKTRKTPLKRHVKPPFSTAKRHVKPHRHYDDTLMMGVEDTAMKGVFPTRALRARRREFFALQTAQHTAHSTQHTAQQYPLHLDNNKYRVG